MTGSKLLLPLRIPELGPALGKLVTGTGRTLWLPLDPIRYRLVTRIIECAGEARGLAANDERAAAVAVVGRTSWLEAWDEAVSDVADLLIARLTEHIEAEARAVRMPKRLRARIGIDDAERGALAARLGSAGANLVSALDELDSREQRAEQTTGSEPNAVDEWQRMLSVAARRLEEAWLNLEEAIERESVQWRRAADRVSAWRRPVWPVVVAGTVLIAVATWLGLVFGGYIDPPEWLVTVWSKVVAQ